MEASLTNKRFWWALLLAWVPWVPALTGLIIVSSNSKATGLAAVAGGLVELLVWWGIVTMFIAQIAAIVWLLRSFSSAHLVRSLIAAGSIMASGLTLFLVGAFLVWGRRLLEQIPAR